MPQVTDPLVSTKSRMQDLALEAARGQDGSLGTLNGRLMVVLTRFLREKWSFDPNQAESLASEAVAEALRELMSGQYDPARAKFLTFAYAIVRRIALMHRDKLRRAREVPLSRFADIGRSTGTEDETLAERIEFVRACLKAESGLTSLTAEERYVLIGLAHQKTLAEIAAELGRSLDTVHRRKMRGLEKVRACLAGKEGS